MCETNSEFNAIEDKTPTLKSIEEQCNIAESTALIAYYKAAYDRLCEELGYDEDEVEEGMRNLFEHKSLWRALTTLDV